MINRNWDGRIVGRGRLSAISLGLILLFFSLCAGVFADSEGFSVAWKKKYELAVASDPLALDIGLDGKPDLILTDNEGRIVALEATTGKLLWKKGKEGLSFSSPLVGNFLGEGLQDLLICGSDKKIRLYEAASGAFRVAFDCGVVSTLPPTLLPSDDSQQGNASITDRFIIIDDLGTIHCFRCSDATHLQPLWDYKTEMQSRAMAAVGSWRGPGKYDVFASDYNGNVYAINGENGALLAKYSLSPGHSISSGIALGQMAGQTGENTIVVGDERGYLYPLRPDPAKAGSLKPIWNPISVLGNPLETLAAVDLNNDLVSDVVSAYYGDLIFVDGLNGRINRWAVTNPPVSAPPVLVTDRSGKHYAFCIDNQGTFYTILVDPQDARTLAEIRNGGLFGCTMTAIDLGEGRVGLIAIEKVGGKIYCFGTPLAADGGPVFWETVGGSMLRSGNLGEHAPERRQAQIANRAEALGLLSTQMQQALSAKDWLLARTKANRLLEIEPGNKEARAVFSRVTFKMRLRYYLAGTILTILMLAIIGRPILRSTWRRRQLRSAESSVQSGNFDQAEQIYKRVLKRFPQDREAIAQLAVLFMKHGDFSADSIPVYESAFQIQPNDLAIIQALARAYLNAGRHDDQALEVFCKASDQFDDPQRLNHALGAIYHQRGDDQAALTYLRKAFSDEYQPHELLLLLADVYLNLQLRAAAAIPMYEAAYAARPQDTRTLVALAECYAAGQRTDAAAEEVYDSLLEQNPDHNEVRLMLAKIRLRQGSHDEAIRHARTVLEAEPRSKEALNVLAQACLAAARSDEEAIDIYRKSGTTFNDDIPLLRSIAFVLLEKNFRDEEAAGIVRKAFRSNREDVALAKPAFELAYDRGERNFMVEAAETLAKCGEATPKVWNALAVVYCDRGSRGDLVETTLRQALATGECDPRVAEMLGAIYAESGRVDANALWVYEALNQQGKLDAATGASFVQALLETGRMEEAAVHSRALLQQFPSNADIQRLSARASMESDRIDEAVREYERILKALPNDQEALVQLATAYARKGRVDDPAMLLYARAQNATPDNPLFPIMKARALAEIGNLRETAEALKETATRGAEAAQKVLEEVERLLHIHPAAIPLRWLMFSLCLNFNKHDAALEQIVRIQDSDPKQTPQAIEAIARILAKDPMNAMALLHRGAMLRQMNACAEARPLLEKAFSILPSEQRVQIELATLYEQILKDNNAGSEADEIRFRLGRLCMALGRYEKAIQSFQVTAQDFRFETESIKRLAECFMTKGMLDLALQEFKKLHMDEEVKDLLYNLAQRYEAKHDLVGAKTVYRQLFAADIGYRNVKEKFEMLAGSTSDPMVFEKTSIISSLSDKAQRRYELVEEIGRGAMGIVYKAHDNELQEIVALKILPDNLSNNPEAVRRFKAEARSARRLSHPNIVRIHDIGEEMGRKYISMEFVEGSDLRRRVKTGGPLPLHDVIMYARQICEALAYAHGEGIVHRDIKPANIMVTKDNRIKVTDFGIAKIAEGPDSTMAGAVLGTPLYMSPEQVQGLMVDNRADLYSFGILLYELISGRPPFTEGDLAYQHMNTAPKPLDMVPEAFWAIVEKCLMKKADDRWATATEILAELGRGD